MKVLVTGAAGFLGSHLTENLIESGSNVRALIHYDSNNNWGWLESSKYKKEIEFVFGDIRDFDDVKKATLNTDIIFHLAFINGTKFFYEKPELVLDVGVKGAINILDCTLNSNVNSFILASSSEVYNNPTIIPTSENEEKENSFNFSFI